MNPILQAMKDISKDTGGFYNARKVLIPAFDRAMLSFVVGQRRIGKTQFFVHLMCHAYQEYGVTTLWLRNKLIEVQELGDGFLYDAKRLGWCPEEWQVRPDGVFTSDAKDADQVCWFKSISTFSNARGSAYPCDLVVFDEFMPEDRRYPKHCATGLISIVKTVCSNRPTARIYALSNSISMVNPYYAKYRVYPRDTVTYYDDKSIVIEKCVGYKQANMNEHNPWLKLYKGTGYSEYADEKDDARWNLLVQHVPKGSEPYPWVLLSNGSYYRGYERRGLVYFTEYKGPLNRLYIIAADREDVNTDCVYMTDGFRKGLEGQLDAAICRFVGANCMFDVMNAVFKEGL